MTRTEYTAQMGARPRGRSYYGCRYAAWGQGQFAPEDIEAEDAAIIEAVRHGGTLGMEEVLA